MFYQIKKQYIDYNSYLTILQESQNTTCQSQGGRRPLLCHFKTQKFNSKNRTHYIKFFPRVEILNKKKRNRPRFSGYKFFLHRTRLHINFRAFFARITKMAQRDLRRRRKRRRQLVRSYTRGSLVQYYKSYFAEQRSRVKWRYYFRSRCLFYNSGFRFRQRLLADLSMMRFFFRYKHHHYVRRFRPWQRYKLLINYRRKILKSEKRRHNLIVYNNRMNYSIRRNRVRYNKRQALRGYWRRKKTLVRQIKRGVQLRRWYQQAHGVRMQSSSLVRKPFWFRRGLRYWRVKKQRKKPVMPNRMRRHFLTLMVLKQGLRSYYGSFRLKFLRQIYNSVRKQQKGNAVAHFINYLESCLFMVMYRANFVSHPKIAIYMIRDNHDIFYVNGRFIHYPLYRLQKGDFFGIKNRVFRKMLNRFLRQKKIPAFLYVNHVLGFGWLIRDAEVRDYEQIPVLPLPSIRLLVTNLKYLV